MQNLVPNLGSKHGLSCRLAGTRIPFRCLCLLVVAAAVARAVRLISSSRAGGAAWHDDGGVG
jgi:hypothetical protein